MYIRWIVRKHKNAGTANVTFHDAYLVESYRDERSEPRQRIICYLGNIRQIGDVFPPIERELFFIRAERIIAGQTEVRPDDRELILRMLRQKVPELSEAEVMIAFRNTLGWFYQRWQTDGSVKPTRDDLIRMVDEASDGMGPI